MNWNHLTNTEQLDEIDKISKEKPVLIYKHSTQCSLSAMAQDRLESSWQKEDINKLTPYYLDLLQYRNISDEIEKRYGIRHQSPQILIIKDGQCIYHNSHMGINYEAVLEVV